MRFLKFLLFLLALLTIYPVAFAQEVITVDGRTLNQHVGHQCPPFYPPIAKAAGIQGTVSFQVEVGTTGKIESMKVVSGPAMLQQAAIDCLKQRTYHPFEKDGVPVAATGPVNMIFTLGGSEPPPDDPKTIPAGSSNSVTLTVLSENAPANHDGELEKKFMQVDYECKRKVLAKNYGSATSTLCKHAAELAQELPTEGNFVARRSAFVYAASALASNGELQDALVWANNAVGIVKLGNDDDSGSSAAYSTKGSIEGMLGNLAAADNDLSAAEDFSRRGIVWVEKEAPSLRSEYVRPLVRDLRFHAQILQKLNQPDEAQKKLDEAAKYN